MGRVRSARVEPAFDTRTAKADALHYARNRFGGGSGQIDIYDEAGGNIVETIPMDDRMKYPNAS
jgi:hypothetical protein